MTLIRHTPLSLPPNFSPGSVMKALAAHWGALLALTLFLVAGLAVLDDYGVIYDAPWQRQNAEANLGYLAGGDFRTYLNAFWVDHDRFYGMAFEIPLLLAERALMVEGDRAIFLSRHLITHLLFLVGGLFAYLLALRLFSGRLVAVAAMLLLLLHPRLHAHSFFNPKDIPFLAMFMIALFVTHRAFKRGNIPAFVLLGATVGLLVNLRIMGFLPLAAVPAMRALDFALASGWEERKRTLLTTGAFALAGALTIYALLPYLWGDPVGRAVEWWAALSVHPHSVGELFRGTRYPNVNFPVEYLPVWFSITAPPFTLLLGAIGAAGVFVRAARAPREALRSGRLRFSLLLAGCFAAPVFAVMLLDMNMYNGWRQMYFLWGPFALLAAFGLAWLGSSLRRTRFRAAAYVGALAGLTATVVSMALLHPNQQDHFNFLVDRVTPERLRSQYIMDYWWQTRRQGREWIIEHSAQPSSQSYITTDHYPVRSLWLRSARALHHVKVYGSTLLVVESRDDLKDVYETVRGREPMIDGAFDVHRIDGALALVMEPCAPAFVERVSVTLRAFPVDPGDLPEWRDEAFEPRRFDLMRYGVYSEGKCIASLPLPAYPLADFELLWSLELLADGEAREKARRAREEGRLLARAAHRAAYDIYLSDGELAYLNDACGPLETAQQFHLNVYPERADDLPEERRERGSERFLFEFLLNGAFVGGGCAAFFPLPDYPVVAIRTGQRDDEGADLWRAEALLDPARRLAESLSGASGEPLAHGAFDIHIANGALVYVKEPCAHADTARFFLHVTPERVGDLPEDRRQYGFDNLDFNFFPNGALFEGRCAARASLPWYSIASIRTGQYDGNGEIWAAEFVVGR